MSVAPPNPTAAARGTLKRPATSPAASPSKPSTSSAKRSRNSYEYYEGELDEEWGYDDEDVNPYLYDDDADDDDDWSDDEDFEDEMQVGAQAPDQRQVQPQVQGQGQGQMQGVLGAGALPRDIGDMRVVDACMAMLNMDDCHARMRIDSLDDDDFVKHIKEAYRRTDGAGEAAIVLAAMHAIHMGAHRNGHGNVMGIGPGNHTLNGIGNGPGMRTGSAHLPVPGIPPGFASLGLAHLSALGPDTFNFDDDSLDMYGEPKYRKDAIVTDITASPITATPALPNISSPSPKDLLNELTSSFID